MSIFLEPFLYRYNYSSINYLEVQQIKQLTMESSMKISRYNLKRFSSLNKQGIVLPSGDYEAVLRNSVDTTLKRNKEMLKLTWQIKDGCYSGKYFFSFFNMNNAESLNVLYKMIHNMGFIPENVQDLREIYGSSCHLIVKCYWHPVHGASNAVERYLPPFNESDNNESIYDSLHPRALATAV